MSRFVAMNRTRRTLPYLVVGVLALACGDAADGPGGDGGGSGATGEPTSSGGANASGSGANTSSGGHDGSMTGGQPGGGPTGAGGDQTGAGGDQTGSGGAPPDDVPDVPDCSEVADWPAEWVAREDAILALVNEYRAEGTTCGDTLKLEVEPLTMDPMLRCAARLHSRDMAERDFFSHGTWDPTADSCTDDDQCAAGYMCSSEFPNEDDRHCGKTPALRVSELGGPSGAGWENIAAGSSSAENTMDDQWMPSAGHCNNIMNGSLRSIGVGYYGGAGTYNHYWTQSFDN